MTKMVKMKAKIKETMSRSLHTDCPFYNCTVPFVERWKKLLAAPDEDLLYHRCLVLEKKGSKHHEGCSLEFNIHHGHHFSYPGGKHLYQITVRFFIAKDKQGIEDMQSWTTSAPARPRHQLDAWLVTP